MHLYIFLLCVVNLNPRMTSSVHILNGGVCFYFVLRLMP